MRFPILTTAFILSGFLSSAQTTQYTEKDYSSSPVWIQMIDDTLANFYQVEKAYNTYWLNHSKPAGDEFEGKQQKGPISNEEAKEIQEEIDMRMAVKKYVEWRIDMQQYVQANGRILTPAERIAQWKTKQELVKEQLKKQNLK
jgi:hypothetical protein